MPGLLPISNPDKVKSSRKPNTGAGDLRLFPDFEYRTEYSRRKTMAIVVSPHKGVIVRAPVRTPVSTIEKFLNEKSGWITKILAGFNSLEMLDKPEGYNDGDSVMLFGRPYLLKMVRSGRNAIRISNGQTIELEHDLNLNPLTTRSILESWFKQTAKNRLASKFGEALVKYRDYEFRPTGFTVRTMKKRWGSCSSRGKIAISYDLIRLDELYSDYVIAHELCHLKHHNHGSGYYKLLSEVFPDWKRTRKELRKYLR